MSIYTNRLYLSLRSMARALGLTRLAARLRSSGYESRFDDALRENIRPGDVVWDVGANVGIYTRKFSDWVGRDGHVVAFEPFPSTMQVLKERCAEYGNVTFVEMALSSSRGVQKMVKPGGGTAAGTTNALSSSGSGTEVQVTTGDDYASRGAHVPSVIKVDVEGYECEVVDGLESTIRSGCVRAVLMEVHFRLLAARDMANAPRALEQKMISWGFAVRWADSSHLVATRLTA